MGLSKLEEKKIKSFIYAIPKLTAIEFIGICNLFKVKILDEDANPRDFGDLLEECIDVFEHLNKTKKKEILKLLKEIQKEKKMEVAPNGSAAESAKKE